MEEYTTKSIYRLIEENTNFDRYDLTVDTLICKWDIEIAVEQHLKEADRKFFYDWWVNRDINVLANLYDTSETNVIKKKHSLANKLANALNQGIKLN